FESAGFINRVEKTVQIESNDPQNPKLDITITGYIEEERSFQNQNDDISRMPIEVRLVKSEYIKPINRLVIFYLKDELDNIDEIEKVISQAGESGNGKAILKIAMMKLLEEQIDKKIENLNKIKCNALFVKNDKSEMGMELVKQSNFPIIHSNQVSPYVIEDFKKLNVGILALLNPTPELTNKYLLELKPKSDIIVLITELSLEEAKRLSQEVEGIDIIIPSETNNKPIKAGNTIIASGSSFGKLNIFLDITRNIIGYNEKAIR
ncbi:MAG: hypothetical protein AB1414_03165, partial [bacterium]